MGDFHEGKVGTINRQSLREIAETKLKDLNASSLDQAMSIIEGTARAFVVLLDEVHDIYTVLSQGRANRRGGSSFTCL